MPYSIDMYFCGERHCGQLFAVMNNVEPENCPMCLSKHFNFSHEAKALRERELDAVKVKDGSVKY